MDAVICRVMTCTGYDECWSEDGLKIAYHGERYYTAVWDGEGWSIPDCEDEKARRYLACSATVSHALHSCAGFGLPQSRVYEFLPQDKSMLIPSELLRQLLDDCGFGIGDACEVLVRYFGKGLCGLPDCTWLNDIQPRTARLNDVLRDSLISFGYAFHDAYAAECRYPLGAIENGTKLRLGLCSFEGLRSVRLVLFSDGFETELPMLPCEDGFYCELSYDTPRALWYCFRLETLSGEKWLCADSDGHSSVLCTEKKEGFRLTVYKKGFSVPDRFYGKVMYQIFPDRFGSGDFENVRSGIEYHRSLGQTPLLHESPLEPVCFLPREGEKDYYPDDFYGGTLDGIRKRLPYLKKLGIGVLYLNPVFESRSNHRYDTSDYGKIDPILGSTEDFEALCSEAEKLGISVVLDGVFSHTGADSIYFNRFGSYPTLGAYQSRKSRFFPWFDFRSFPDDYRCWWGFKALPETDELNPDWQDYIIRSEDSIVRRWLRLGASGWRLDVADELPDEVLSQLRTAAKEEKPDCLLIGEVWEDAVIKESYGARRNYALGYSLDSVMNYPFRTAVTNFARGKSSAFELRDFLLSQRANYPKPMYLSLMNLLGSHDVERLFTLLGASCEVSALDRTAQSVFRLNDNEKRLAAARQRLCAVIQYSVPGMPCLYYGDEECLEGGRDPFNRAPYKPQMQGLFGLYARLAEIRNNSPALTGGELEILCPSPEVILIFRKSGQKKICCAVNRSEESFKLPINNAEPLLGVSDGKSLPPVSADIFITGT